MSTARTGRSQLARLRAPGWRVALLEELVDVDDIETARLVAARQREGRFARCLRRLDRELDAAVVGR